MAGLGVLLALSAGCSSNPGSTSSSGGQTAGGGSGGTTAGGGSGGTTTGPTGGVGGSGGTAGSGGIGGSGGVGGSGGMAGSGGAGGGGGIQAEWVKVFPIAKESTIDDLATDAEGNVYVAGGVQKGPTDLGAGAEPCDTLGGCGFLLKLDPNGNLLWHKLWNLGQLDFVHVAAITWTADGLLAALRWAHGKDQGSLDLGLGALTPHGTGNIVIARLDADGNAVWNQGYGSCGGGICSVEPLSIVSEGATDFTVLGQFAPFPIDIGLGSMAQLGAFDYPMFIARFVNGAPVWQHAFNGEGGGKAVRVVKTPDGGYSMAGMHLGAMLGASFIPPTINGESPFSGHYDADGNPVWGHVYNDTSGANTRSGGGDSTGALLIGGYGTNQIDTGAGQLPLGSVAGFLLKIDANGQTVFSTAKDKNAFTFNCLSGVATDPSDAMLWVARRETPQGNEIGFTGRVTKLDVSGAEQWELIAPDFGPSEVVSDPQGSVIVGGKYRNQLTIGKDGPSAPANGASAFVAKFASMP